MKPYYEQDGITIYHADCLEVLPTLSQVGLIVTDPPYTFGLSSTMQRASKAGGWHDLMNSARFLTDVLVQCKKSLCGNGAAWVFNSWRSFPVMARASYEADWPILSLLIWDKQGIGAAGTVGLRPTYEASCLFTLGNYRISNRSTPDIWREPWHTIKPSGHPAEKPVALLRRMIHAGTFVGSVVDPFMGSGSTLVAAKEAGHRAVGIELEERWCEVAARRLEQQVLGLGAA